jgi:FkbM family methyltransferase
MQVMNSVTKSSLIGLGEAYRWYMTRAQHPLKAKLIGHFWSRFSRPRVWVRYDDELVISVSLRDYIQAAIFYEGCYEPHLIDWLKNELKQTDVFWDVGANIGAMTLVAATHCRSVVSFEPDPRSLDRLRSHISANALGNIQIVDVALSNQNGFAYLSLGAESNTGMSSMVPSQHGSSVKKIVTATADSLIMQRGLPLPNVMKIDVEGAEDMVFHGARNTLGAPGLRAIVFESMEGRGGLPRKSELVELLTAHSFVVKVFGRSDPLVNDGMQNYIALRQVAP